MDELIVFSDEDLPENTAQATPWKVLIVDDEPNVHKTTEFALAKLIVEDRPLQLISAYSAAEAIDVLDQHSDEIACILLDVVMETDDAGLRLVNHIRNNQNNDRVRIILRTGQPGSAPESQVIIDYDINDYETKSELTRQRLVTSMVTALKSYNQLEIIEHSQQGLSKIIDSTASLFTTRQRKKLMSGIIHQACELLKIPANGVVYSAAALTVKETPQDVCLELLAAAGDFLCYQDMAVEKALPRDLVKDIRTCFKHQSCLFFNDRLLLFMDCGAGNKVVLYLQSNRPVNEVEKNLLLLYCNVATIGIDNISMFNEVEYLAYHDPLTGLQNRSAFINCINQQFKSAANEFILVLIHINCFQEVNDGLGSIIGDKLVSMTGKMLQQFCPNLLAIAHLNQDQYGLLLPYKNDAKSGTELGRLAQQFASPLVVEKNQILVQLEMGVCRSTQDGHNADKLLRRASVALKQAKLDCAEKICFYDPQMSTLLKQRLKIIQELRPAIHQNEFFLQYQPQLNMISGQPEGVEALVRWKKLNNGTEAGQIVPPFEFIPPAEESGLIVELGYWILRTACRQQVQWQSKLGNLRMAVNVSMRQFQEPDFVDRAIEIIRDEGIDPACLELEVTESLLMQDYRQIIAKLQALRAEGIQIAMDDFGTGYSSLSYLQRLPLDRLKVDHAFVSNIENSSEDRSIAAMIVGMGHELGLYVLAEGIENEHQQSILQTLGCDEAQGYLYAKPLPADEIVDYFRLHASHGINL